jgi:hypothetical protein
MPDVTQQARDIHARALHQVVCRIEDCEHAYPPSVIPIVAANVAMAAMLDQLLDYPYQEVGGLFPVLLDVCNPTAPSRGRVTR